jgi:4-hydroxy-tetrahydrodipicolinate synthase
MVNLVWNEFRETSGYFEIPLVKAAIGARIADFPLHVRPQFTPVPAEEIDRIRSVIIKCLSDFKTIAACA